MSVSLRLLQICCIVLLAAGAAGRPAVAVSSELVTESHKLIAERYGGFLGSELAIDGETIMAQGWELGFPEIPDVHVFTRRDQGGWSDSYLLEDGNDFEDFLLGEAIAIDGSRALIGAAGITGSLNAYERDSSGRWAFSGRTFLYSGSDLFEVRSLSVALDQETAVVPYTGIELVGEETDTTALYQRDGSVWTERQRLGTASPVAIDDGVILKGDPGADGLVAAAGAVEVWKRDASDLWQPVALLSAPDGHSGAAFGCSVAIEGRVALIGACGDNEAGSEAGAAYIFFRDPAGGWQRGAKLLPSITSGRKAFGADIALGDGVALVMQIDDVGEQIAGCPSSQHVLVFAPNTAGAWREVVELAASDGTEFQDFGAKLDLDGTTAVVGAPGLPCWGEDGAVYVYELSSLIDRPPLKNLNLHVSFEPEPSSFDSSGHTVGCSLDSVGAFRFTAMLGNTSPHRLAMLQLEIAELNRGNELLTAQGLLGVGERMLVPRIGGYENGELLPGEMLEVPFTVCLQSREAFRFVLDVIGTTGDESNAD